MLSARRAAHCIALRPPVSVIFDNFPKSRNVPYMFLRSAGVKRWCGGPLPFPCFAPA
jgi:hypothetical protein